MTAQLTDNFMQGTPGGGATTLASPGKALGASSINVANDSGFQANTGFVVAIRQIDSNGNEVSGTYTEWMAIKSGNNVLTINPTPVYGTDQVYTSGSTIQVYAPISAYAQTAQINALLTTHNQDGSLINQIVTLGKINGGTTAGLLQTSSTGAVTPATSTLDANGWTVVNGANGKPEYRKRWTGLINNPSLGANGWATFTTDNLPVGVANTSGLNVQATATGGSSTDPACFAQIHGNGAGTDSTTNTTFTLSVRNTYSGGSVGTGYWTLYITLKTI